MHNCIHSCRVTILSGLLLSTFLSIAAKADQIVVLVDDQGHKIYVNTGETSTRVDWMTRSFQPNPAPWLRREKHLTPKAKCRHPGPEIALYQDQKRP